MHTSTPSTLPAANKSLILSTQRHDSPPPTDCHTYAQYELFPEPPKTRILPPGSVIPDLTPQWHHKFT